METQKPNPTTKAAPPAGTQMQGQITKAGTPGYDNTLGPREVRVLASTAAVDLMNEKVNPLGMQNSPCDIPVFFNHNSAAPDALPIGRAYLRATPSGVVGKIVFAPEGDDELADRVCRACKSGVADSVSIGFLSVKTSRSKDGRVLTYDSWVCNELSVVGVGANPEARITQRALGAGNPKRDARMAKALAVRERGERRLKGAVAAGEARELERIIAAAEKLAGPHPTDGMSRAQRAAYAAAVVARGAPATPSASATGRELQNQNNAQHAALVGAHSMERYPTKATRVIKAGLTARSSRPVGFG